MIRRGLLLSVLSLCVCTGWSPPAPEVEWIDTKQLSPVEVHEEVDAHTCSGGGCSLACQGACTATCSGGGCNHVCEAGGSCEFTCSGGGCNQACAAGSKCELTCSGGGCNRACDAADCGKTCAGGGCQG